MTLRLLPASGAPVEVSKDTAVVGREPACDVHVSDGSVSRKHARLERLEGDKWKVVDQGSANGTYVDGKRVADAELKNGQELRFGAVTFKVELPEREPEADMAATIVGSEATILQAAVPMPPPAPPAAAAPPPPPPPRSRPCSARA